QARHRHRGDRRHVVRAGAGNLLDPAVLCGDLLADRAQAQAAGRKGVRAVNKTILSLSILLALGGCSLIPDYQRPAPPVAATLPGDGVYAGTTQAPTATPPEWRGFFRDPALQQLIAVALD